MSNGTAISGKHDFITGGGHGIGGASAKVLAANGAKLTLTGRNMEKLEAIEKIMGRSWYLMGCEAPQRIQLRNYDLIYREIECVLNDQELDESFYSATNSYS